MKIAFFAGLAAGVILLAASSTTFAHHNTLSRYDHDRPITLQGTVTLFRMISPHSRMEFEVKQADGTVVKWEAEGGSPASAYRRGWRTGDLKVGDSVTVTGSPAVDGSRWLEIKKVVTPSGKELE
jgi:hypothetical protein